MSERADRLDCARCHSVQRTSRRARQRQGEARRGVACPRAGDRRGDADERRHGLLLRGRQARDPAARGLRGAATLVAAKAHEWDATAVGGMTMGADPVACAALGRRRAGKAFFVRKETKAHGLTASHRGSPAHASRTAVSVVEDVVTTGGSTLARDRRAARRPGTRSVGSCLVLIGSRAAAPRSKTAAGAPYVALTTIDDVYPERDER